MFYNKAHFREKSIPVPTNLDDFSKACKVLTDPANNRYGFFIYPNGWYFEPFFFAFGGFGREIFYRVTDMVGLGRSAWLAYACAIFTMALMIGPAILFKKWFPFAVGVIKKKKPDTKEIN